MVFERFIEQTDEQRIKILSKNIYIHLPLLFLPTFLLNYAFSIRGKKKFTCNFVFVFLDSINNNTSREFLKLRANTSK